MEMELNKMLKILATNDGSDLYLTTGRRLQLNFRGS